MCDQKIHVHTYTYMPPTRLWVSVVTYIRGPNRIFLRNVEKGKVSILYLWYMVVA